MTEEFITKGLGRRPAPDARDRLYPMAAALRPRSLPTQRYYTMHRSLPLDQGETSTCVAHAWVAFLLCAPLMCANAPSPYDMYRGFIPHDEFPENDHEVTLPNNGLQYGSSVRAGAQYLRSQGFVKSFVWSRGADEAAVWLLSGSGTIVLGTDWYWDMSTPDKRTGFVNLSGSLAGGHAYLAIGYSRTRKAFRCLNSWGREYGDKGRFWVRHDDMNRLIRQHDGEACAAVEQYVPPVSVQS